MHRILHALATDEFTSIEEAAIVEEWLLRPFRRRAAWRCLREAHVVTRESDGPHVARVARLFALRISLPDVNDIAAVSAAYATLPPVVPRRAPVQSLVFGAVITLALVLGFGFRILTRPFDASTSVLGEGLANGFGTHVAAVANGARPTPAEAFKTVFPHDGAKPPLKDAMMGLFEAQVAALPHVAPRIAKSPRVNSRSPAPTTTTKRM